MKTKRIADGHYAIVGTTLDIVRGDPPRYRHPQEWWVVERETDNVLLMAHGKWQAADRIGTILKACGAAVPGVK